MGWTSYNAEFYKNGKVDRKAEMDNRWTQEESEKYPKLRVLKSSMVGNIYYAAIEISRGGKVEQVFATTAITSTNMKDYYNFSYKDLDETMGGCNYDCPVGILNLLTPTDNEYALQWRTECLKQQKKKKEKENLRKSLIQGKKYLIKLWNGKTFEAEWSTYMNRKRFVNYNERRYCDFKYVEDIKELEEQQAN
ncbi:MAG: hypothetical protein PT942_03135 [Eubacteriales bacterium]|nr:hypothetical protein [Eubacteriales bacterium]